MNKFKSVTVDKDKCTGCRVCEYICSIHHCKVFNPSRSRIRVVRNYPHSNAAFACRMCEDTPCVVACPRKAMTQNPETGVIHVNEDLCEEGCNWCVKACEYGSINIEDNKARLCDLCKDREAGPACIEWCPEEALELKIDESVRPKAQISAAGGE